MLSCESHQAFIYDRGGRRQIGDLGLLSRVRWERLRDDISVGNVDIATVSKDCAELLSMTEAGRHELVLYRGPERVWEGPITRVGYYGNSVQIEAKDVMYYVNRTIMRNEYDNRYPNNGPVIDRIKRIMVAEMARKEALDPTANILAHIRYIQTPNDAGTAAHTLPYELTVFQHIDEYAARGGIDYTVVGRSILFFDVHTKIGQTAMVTKDDFIGDPVITQYGAELGTYIAMTDGKGNFGAAGGTDPYYGDWEILNQAYDENNANADTEPPSVAEMTSQAERFHSQSKIPPMVVRIPDGTALNPNGALAISDLVPGVWIPLTASVPGRTLSQMQKLDKMSVEEIGTDNGAVETIKVTLSPAGVDRDGNEEEE